MVCQDALFCCGGALTLGSSVAMRGLVFSSGKHVNSRTQGSPENITLSRGDQCYQFSLLFLLMSRLISKK